MRRRMLGAIGDRLPYDAELEWINGDGSPFVKVPCSANMDTTRVKIKGYVTNTNTDLFSFNNDKRIQFNIENNSTYYRWFSDKAINIGNDCLGVLHDYDCGETIYKDGVKKGTSNCDVPISTEFMCLLNGFHGWCKGRVCYVKVENASINYDLIPVRKGGLGYFFDKLSMKLIGRSDTGEGFPSYLLGPDKT